jgi:hypothetical protein
LRYANPEAQKRGLCPYCLIQMGESQLLKLAAGISVRCYGCAKEVLYVVPGGKKR